MGLHTSDLLLSLSKWDFVTKTVTVVVRRPIKVLVGTTKLVCDSLGTLGVLTGLFKLSPHICELIILISVDNSKFSQVLRALLVLFLRSAQLLSKRVNPCLCTAQLNLLLSVQLADLLLLLVDFFLGTRALLPVKEVSVAVILHSTLLNRIDLDILGTNVVLELGNLPLQVLNHLLTCLEHLLLRVVVRVSSVELSLLLLELELHLLHVLLHALHFEVVALKFTLGLPAATSFFFEVFSQLYEHLVFLKLD